MVVSRPPLGYVAHEYKTSFVNVATNPMLIKCRYIILHHLNFHPNMDIKNSLLTIIFKLCNFIYNIFVRHHNPIPFKCLNMTITWYHLQMDHLLYFLWSVWDKRVFFCMLWSNRILHVDFIKIGNIYIYDYIIIIQLLVPYLHWSEIWFIFIELHPILFCTSFRKKWKYNLLWDWSWYQYTITNNPHIFFQHITNHDS